MDGLTVASLTSPQRGNASSWRVVALVLAWGALLSIPAESFAQGEAFREEWRWASYGPDEGLTGGAVLKFLETSSADIWAVTEGGIYRFDGFGWYPGTGLGLPHGYATAAPLPVGGAELLVVVSGRAFQGGEEGFAETFTIGANPLPDLDSVTSLANGDILLTTSGGGVVYHPSTDSLGLVAPPRENARVYGGSGALFARSGDSLWFQTDEEWVRIPAGTAGLPHVWVGSGEALFGFRSSARATRGVWNWSSGGTPRQIPGQETRVSALTIGPGGDAIVTSTTGAVHVRLDGAWGEMMFPSPQLAEAKVLHYSLTGDLWTATDDLVHLYRSDPGLWSHPPIVGDLEIQSILAASDGSIWVGTESELTIVRPDGRSETTRTIGEDSLQVISGLAEDADGNVWISSGASFTGIYRWNGDSWRHFGAADGFADARVHHIVAGNNGRLWLMALDGGPGPTEAVDPAGPWFYDGSGFYHLEPPPGGPLGRTYDMAEAPDGTLWFGAASGLYRLADGVWTRWAGSEGLASARVFTVAVDAGGRPWFGHQAMGGGLGTIDDDDSVSYETTADLLLSDEVSDIEVDGGGVIWLATDRGVGRRENGVFTSFDRQTGLGHQLLWPLALAGDSVWVGSMGGGVFVLRPENASGFPPVVMAHDPLISDNVAVQRLTPLSYKGEIHPASILIRYRLDEETWSGWATGRRIFAFDLAPGEHSFSLQVRDQFGNVGEPTRLPTFTIAPPIYRHPLVIGIVAVWLGSMIFVAVVFLRRRRAQLVEVRDRERHFRTLIENATDMITVLSEDATIMYESPSSQRLLGSPPEGLQGAAALNFVHRDDRPKVEAELAQAFENPGTMHSMEFRFRHSDGHWVDLESVGRVNPEHFSPRRIVLNSRDVTQRKNAERAMEELQAELRHAHKMDALGTMAGGIAHDFNNILTAIMGYAEILRDTFEEGDSARQDLDQILAGTQRARDLVAQILTFSTRSEAAIRPLKPASILNEAEKLLRASIPSTIDIGIRTADEAGTINADPGQIHQLLMNLGTNAAHAMRDGGGKLTILLETTVVDAETMKRIPGLEPGPHVRLTVTDTGVGIPENVLPLIYDPFFTTKKVGEGTGLGLSVVHGIVTNQRGRIVVQSTPGKGSVFEVYLPCIEDVVVPSDDPGDETQPGGAERILIVDDEPQIAAVSAAMLLTLGYRPTICESSTKAAELLTRPGHSFALLLSDYTMPVMTGVELTENIRSANVAIPVIIMTGYGQSIESENLPQLGISSVLMKPFKKAELGSAVRSALQTSPQAPEPAAAPDN